MANTTTAADIQQVIRQMLKDWMAATPEQRTEALMAAKASADHAA